MKRKTSILCVTSALMVSLLGGCGNVQVQDEFVYAGGQPITTERPEASDRSEADSVGTQTPSEVALTVVQELELKYSSGSFQANDLRSLAQEYMKQSRMKKGREMLETAYLLYGDEETKALLQNVTVNTAEESPQIQEKMSQLASNFEIPEYEDEVVGMLLSEDWYTTMLPGETLVSRSYYHKQGDALYFVQVARKDNGQKYTLISRERGADVSVIRMEGSTVQRVDSQWIDGAYNGEFESWVVDKNTGDIIHETGTFADNRYVGDYTAEVRWGSDKSDIFTLWTSKEDVKTLVYNGHFDENGLTTIDQSSADKVKRTAGAGAENPVIYAVGTDGKRCLFVDGGSAETLTFDINTFGLPQVPAYVTYEPVAEEPDATSGILQQKPAVSGEALKVRVYDGQIQIFDGTSWYNMGSVAEYVAADPMADLKEQAIAAAIAKAESEKQEEEVTDVSIRSAGTITGKVQTQTPGTPTPTKKPVATQKPVATKKPVATQKPATTQKPVVPTQAPPTQAPPTQAPPTQAPPTQAPPTQAPPTQAPPTQAPPTQAPPTQAPPTQAPPTQAPPTQAPPTQSPPSSDTDTEYTPDMM